MPRDQDYNVVVIMILTQTAEVYWRIEEVEENRAQQIKKLLDDKNG